jgi:undecaprenyl pyrophosphate synthase
MASGGSSRRPAGPQRPTAAWPARHATQEAARLGIGQLTPFCLSTKNWKPPRRELDLLIDLLEQYVIEKSKPQSRPPLRPSCDRRC